MQVSAETTQGLERRITITIPGADIARALQDRLRSLAQSTRIDGFRPGKIPVAIVQRRFGAQAHREVLGDMLKSALSDTLVQQQWRLANNPKFDPVSVGKRPDDDVCYTATFEIYPAVELAPMEGATINQPAIRIEDADVDAVIERLRRQRQVWTKVERPAALDDRAEIDFVGTLAEDGTPFPGGTGNGVFLVLGSGQFIGDFEQRLVGALAGETRTVDVTFPANYHHAELAGKDAQFRVTVQSVESGQLPELDEAFVRTLGVADGTIETLRQEVRQGIERDCAGKVRELLKTQALDWLYRNNPLELPRGLVAEELADLRASAANPANAADGAPGEQAIEELARRHVALGLLLGEIVRRQKLRADPEQVRAYVRAAADEYEDPEQVERWYASDSKRMQEIEAVVIEDMAVEWILKQVQLTPVPVSLSELLHPTPAVASV